MDANIHTALRTFVLCNPALAGALAAVGTGHAFAQEEDLRVTGDVVTVREAALSGDAATLAGLVAEGLIHVLLGHPREIAATDVDARAFDAACRLRARNLIEDAPTMPTSMFSGDQALDDLRSALRAAGIDARGTSAGDRDALARAIAGCGDDRVAAALAATTPALVADPSPRPGVANALGLALALHEDFRGDALATNIAKVTGAYAIDPDDAPADFGTFVRAFGMVRAARGIDEALDVMRRIDAMPETGVDRRLLASAALEELLRSLKRQGHKSQEIAAAFQARALSHATPVLRGGPLIRLGDMRPEPWTHDGASSAWMVDGGGVVAKTGEHDGRPEITIAMPRAVAARVGDTAIVVEDGQTTLAEWTARMEQAGTAIRYLA